MNSRNLLRRILCAYRWRAVCRAYTDGPSRPNIPVNVQVGLETPKSGFGRSNEERQIHRYLTAQNDTLYPLTHNW